MFIILTIITIKYKQISSNIVLKKDIDSDNRRYEAYKIIYYQLNSEYDKLSKDFCTIVLALDTSRRLSLPTVRDQIFRI